MKASVSTPGTIVHLLSQVEFSVSDSSKKSESFHAVQFRPLEPLVGWNFSNVILSRVTTKNPFSFDMNEEKYSKETQPHKKLASPMQHHQPLPAMPSTTTTHHRPSQNKHQGHTYPRIQPAGHIAPVQPRHRHGDGQTQPRAARLAVA